MASRKWHEEMKKDEVIHHFRPESFDVQVKVLNSKGQSGAMDIAGAVNHGWGSSWHRKSGVHHGHPVVVTMCCHGRGLAGPSSWAQAVGPSRASATAWILRSVDSRSLLRT